MYYHLGIRWDKSFHYERDRNEGVVRVISESYNAGEKFLFDGTWVSPNEIRAIHIFATEFPSDGYPVSVFSLHEDEVTRHWIRKPPQTPMNSRSKQHQEATSRNVFIVHGRDHEPMKELKTMLFEFGLNPIVLHEQPSGSMTIVEKLEKYSDVGYTFVILTPDDIGGLQGESSLALTILDFEISYRTLSRISKEKQDALTNACSKIRDAMKGRARQNVVLEFGYFIGLLGRNRVCCLHKGDVELPSDMHGIVYIRFEKSVEEIRIKIMKELKEAGYEIKI